jgi:hypothetical protein
MLKTEFIKRPNHFKSPVPITEFDRDMNVSDIDMKFNID